MAHTAESLIAELKSKNPGKIFAKNGSGTSVAVFHDNRWVGVYSQLIGDLGWAPYPAVFADDQPLIAHSEWIEA